MEEYENVFMTSKRSLRGSQPGQQHRQQVSAPPLEQWR